MVTRGRGRAGGWRVAVGGGSAAALALALALVVVALVVARVGVRANDPGARWGEAEGRLTRWLARFPADGGAWVRLGGLRHFRGDDAGALAAFRYESGATGLPFIADMMGGGVGLIDYDGDGRLDVSLVSGCKLPVGPGPPLAPNRLYRNRGDGTFEDVTARAGVGGRGYGMGCAAGDYDNDGRVDLVVVHRDAPPALLRNVTDAGHFLGLRLRGTRSSATPVGARVACRVGGKTLVRWVTGGTGYLSANDPRLWFGLGPSRSVDALEIRWPSGAVQRWTGVGGDRVLEVREGGDPRANAPNLRHFRTKPAGDSPHPTRLSTSSP